MHIYIFVLYQDFCKGCRDLNSGIFKILHPISLRGIRTSAQNAARSQSTIVDSAIHEDGLTDISPSNGRVMLIDGTSIIYRAYYKLIGM